MCNESTDQWELGDMSEKGKVLLLTGKIIFEAAPAWHLEFKAGCGTLTSHFWVWQGWVRKIISAAFGQNEVASKEATGSVQTERLWEWLNFRNWHNAKALSFPT